MTYIVFHNQLAFQPVNREGLATGDPEVVTKGGAVPDYVAPFIVHALTAAGMVVDAGDRELPPVFDAPPALPNPEQPLGARGEPPLLTLSGDPLDHDADSSAVAGQLDGGNSYEVVTTKPKATESKAKWESYAVSVGIDRGEAESMTKPELVAAVEARESE
jgi:hypothetical protein